MKTKNSPGSDYLSKPGLRGTKKESKMKTLGHLPELVTSLKEAVDFEPGLDERPRCLCGEIIDSDDPDEAFCIDCKVTGAEILCGILEDR